MSDQTLFAQILSSCPPQIISLVEKVFLLSTIISCLGHIFSLEIGNLKETYEGAYV